MKALAVGAVLAIAVPGTAYANTVGVTVKTPGATAGPGSTFSEISTHADCAGGLISGGGINQAIGTGSSSNGNHVNGTGPSSDGSTKYLGSTGVVGTDVTHWLAIGGGGGATNETYAYAVCSGAGINVGGATVTVRNSEASGPNTATSGQTVTVGCGGNDGKLVSGGAAISSGDVTGTDFTGPGSGGDHLNGSYPSDADGNPVADGTTTASYWTAYTHTGGAGSSGNHSDAWALCANDGV
ncbi:hypothetical protein GCM10010505_37100 [Kitasatospora aburaviensis]